MKRHVWTVAFLTFGLVGCTASSDQPLCSTERAIADDDLFGRWVLEWKDYPDGQRTEFLVGRSRDEKGREKSGAPMHVHVIDIDELTRTTSSERLALLPTRIGDKKYASIEITTKKPGDPPVYLIVKYEVVANKLRIWTMDPRQLKIAVDQGKLKGVVLVEDKRRPQVSITDSTQNIARFVATTDDQTLFGRDPVATYTRLPLH